MLQDGSSGTAPERRRLTWGRAAGALGVVAYLALPLSLYLLARAFPGIVPAAPEVANIPPRIASFHQGKDSAGKVIAAQLSNPVGIIEGSSESDTTDTWFCVLGIGGSVVLEFPGGITNGPGADILIAEHTQGGDPLERARISVSEDGRKWTPIGMADNSLATTSSPVAVTPLDLRVKSGRYVRVRDITAPSTSDSQNGFDLLSVRLTGAGE